ncbi:MAG: DUF4783 domain-containing protein [Chitinophagaceae bacterium]|nr:DUF4783 domain-containing protein [Chitinophagaceae bacterium]
MKKVFLFMAVSICSFAFIVQSDSDDILKALKAANVEQLTEHFDSFVDLKLPEKDEVKNMSKNQASIALKSFFNDNSIKSFELASQREMGGTMYIAGKLKNNDKGFNITIMAKKSGEKHNIISIRIN